MHQIVPQIILDNTFILSTDRCLYWQEEKTLILSDLHLGKTGHFRKEGIPVPQAVLKEDMQRFVSLIQLFKPEKIFVIGDMFHSHANKELDFFLKWRSDFQQVPIVLIKGNHDILKPAWYSEAGVEVSGDNLTIGNFIFAHDIACCEVKEGQYAFSGHIHPGISMYGLGRQSLQFACFYFGHQYAVLPAFSRFTGTYPIRQKKGESVYAIIPANRHKGEMGGMIKV